ncbi:MAG: twin-arginine translocase TatA/TatE family subunit [Flavobacteriales bacterium]
MERLFYFCEVRLLFLNSISTGEIITIMFFILFFFGAKSIPKIARTAGRTIRQIKDATQSIQRDIEDSAKDSAKEIHRIETDVKKEIDTPEL